MTNCQLSKASDLSLHGIGNDQSLADLLIKTRNTHLLKIYYEMCVDCDQTIRTT